MKIANITVILNVTVQCFKTIDMFVHAHSGYISGYTQYKSYEQKKLTQIKEMLV